MTDATFDPEAALVEGTAGREPRTHTDKVVRVVLWVALLLTAALVAGLFFRMIGEQPDRNSYAILADAFLHGRLYVTDCFDVDCAFYNGQTYIAFPPAPAVLSMPFVAIFGPDFAGFIALCTLLTGAALWTWWRILKVLGVERQTAVWLILAIAVGSPLFYVTIRGDGIWFMAHCCAFLASSLAMLLVLERRSLVLAGALIGFAFLSRQMSIFLLPFVFALHLRQGEPLISFRRDYIVSALKIGLPVLVAVGIYLAYNYARFGDIGDTGYEYIWSSLADKNYLYWRHTDIGLFSSDYVVTNLLYLFVQGFHVDLTGKYLTEFEGMDALGASLFAASPFVLMALFTPIRRPIVIGLICVAAMVVPMLFYHSNGFTQYNAQRYVLDWLPILAFALAFAITRANRPVFAVLVTYAIGLNLAMASVMYVTSSA